MSTQAINEAVDAALETAYNRGYEAGLRAPRPGHREVVAHLVGGPKAGEVMALRNAVTIHVSRISGKSWEMGDLTAQVIPMATDLGCYRRDRQLVGGEFGPYEWIYIWQGWGTS